MAQKDSAWREFVGRDPVGGGKVQQPQLKTPPLKWKNPDGKFLD